MKERLAYLLVEYSIQITIYIALLFIYTADSMIALVIYSSIVHILTILLVIGLYAPNSIKVGKIRPLFRLIEFIIIIAILVISEHWYTLGVSCFLMLLASAYMFDEISSTYIFDEKREK